MKINAFLIIVLMLLVPLSVSAQQMSGQASTQTNIQTNTQISSTNLNTTQRTLAQIIAKRKVNLKTGGYNGSFSTSYQGSADGQNVAVSLNGTFDGTVVSKNSQSIDSAEGTYSLSLNLDQNLAKMFGAANENITFQIKSILGVNQKYDSYIRVTSASSRIVMFLNSYAQMLGIKSPSLFTWFKAPSQSTITRSYDTSSSFATKFTPEQQKFIIEKFVTTLDIRQDKGVEQVNSYLGRHFVLSMTAAKFKQFIIDISPITNKTAPSAKERAELDKTFAEPMIQDLFAKMAVDVWLGENDGQIYKMTMRADNWNISSKDTRGSIKLLIDMNLKNVHPNFKVTKPTRFVDLDALFKKSLGSARVKAQDAMIKANIASLAPDAVMYWDKNATYVGYCSTPRAQEVARSIKQITHTYSCRESKNNAMFSAKITNGYFCGDTANGNTAVKTNPAHSKYLFCK